MIALPFSPKKSSSSSQISLYLQKIHWQTRKFTNQELEVLLVDKMIQYLENKSVSIDFICGFAKEIQKKIGDQINSKLFSMITIILSLDKKIKTREIKISNNETIQYIIDKTQKIATGKSFIHS